MLNLLSILIGLVVFVLALVGFVPLLGALNWVTIPLALLGVVLGALSSRTSGRNLNLILMIFCAVRLSLGGGLL